MVIRPSPSAHTPNCTYATMLRNYFRTALRALRRRLGYTIINVVGLAIGIAACLLIGLYVRHEWSYDRFHDDADRIHRIVGDYGETQMATTQWPVIREIRREHPSLTVAPFFATDAVVGRKTRRFNEDQVFIAQPSFFDVFTFPAQRGMARAAFERPYTAVLTPQMAEKYFGDANPIGKSLRMAGLWGDNSVSVTVTGILEPIPDASHFHPRIIVSWATLNAAFNFSEQMRGNWSGGAFRAYLKVPEGTQPAALANRFTTQALERADDRWNPQEVSLRLQPITAIHLHSSLDFELEPNGSAAYVYLFIGVALIILVLACVNFVNLALARSAERTTEVGVRKAIGAGRGQIIWQFLTETFLLSVGALGLALGFSAAAGPLFQSLTGIAFRLEVLTEPIPLAILAGVTVVTAFGAASYPALVLSRFDPGEVLGGRSQGGLKGSSRRTSRLRRGLVVFQFAVAVALGASTTVAYWQLNYLQTTDLGFDEQQVVTVPMPPSAPNARRPFQREAAQQPGIQAVSRGSASLPARLLRHAQFALADQGVADENRPELRFVTVDYDFFEALGVETVAGRTFQRGRAADSSAVVLNETALDLLVQDLPADQRTPSAATGRSLEGSVPWLIETPTVIGVVEDAHLGTMYESIKPTIFVLSSLLQDTYYMRLDASQTEPTLSRARSAWEKVYPDAPFAYEFADQAFASAYRSEQRTSTLFGVFAALALVIAGLGLFGLAAFATQQRRKEVSIRKAFGASMGQLIGRLSKDFVALVGVAILIALPVAYVALTQWLSTFAYHIDLGVRPFVLASGGALLIALVAVGAQAVRTARVDPSAVLRDE